MIQVIYKQNIFLHFQIQKFGGRYAFTSLWFISFTSICFG